MSTGSIVPREGNQSNLMADKFIGVLLVVHHDIVREGLKLILDKEHDIRVVGETRNGAEGIELYRDLLTAQSAQMTALVVAISTGLPDQSGFAVGRVLRELNRHARLLMLGYSVDTEQLTEMVDVGADGFLLTGQARSYELAYAVRTVARGDVVLSPSIARELLNMLTVANRRKVAANDLTAREIQVLELLSSGNTTKEIARKLELSTRTIENHRARILSKFGANTTAEAIAIAAEQNLIPTY